MNDENNIYENQALINNPLDNENNNNENNYNYDIIIDNINEPENDLVDDNLENQLILFLSSISLIYKNNKKLK